MDETRKIDGLAELFGMMRDFGKRLDTLSKRLSDHMDAEERAVRQQTQVLGELSERVDALGELVKAFPHTEDGVPDLHGHRIYHDGLIVEAKEKGKFWQSMKEHIGKNILTALMMLLLLGLNAHILSIVDEKKQPEPQRIDQRKLLADAVADALKQHDAESKRKK